MSGYQNSYASFQFDYDHGRSDARGEPITDRIWRNDRNVQNEDHKESRYRDRSPYDEYRSSRDREERRRRRHRSRDHSRERSYSRERRSSREDDRGRYHRDRPADDKREHWVQRTRAWRDTVDTWLRDRAPEHLDNLSTNYGSRGFETGKVKDEWMAHVWGRSNVDTNLPENPDTLDNYDRNSYRSQVPNNTLILRGLGFYITEADIKKEMLNFGVTPKDIRLIRKKETGSLRGFAFVEFNSVDEAKEVVEKNDGELRLLDHKVIVQYSIPRDEYERDNGADWYCKCMALNFKRREFCYKCGADRKSCESIDYEEGSSHPTHTVMLKGLDAFTTEEMVLKVIQTLSSLPIRSVRIGRDKITNVSRGICYLEMNTVNDAMYLHNTLLSEKLCINGKCAQVSYCKNTPVASNISAGSASNAGNAAIAAAQWSHQNSDNVKHSLADVPRLAEYSASLYAKNDVERETYIKHYTEYYTKVINEGGTISSLDGSKCNPSSTGYQAAVQISAAPVASLEPPSGLGDKCYPVPDVSKYQYDKASGYYYDPITTMYYDANSQYYFNSKIKQFMYWDGNKRTYLLAPNTTTSDDVNPQKNNENVNEDDKKNKEKGEDKDKVKVAKRIAKDMEKWAKTLNHKKEIAKHNLVASLSLPEMKAQGAADIGFAVLGRKEAVPSSPLNFGVSTTQPTAAAGGGDSLVAEYGDGSESEEESEELQQDDQHVDWTKMACLLCKRQFPNPETLLKHQQLSDLHKQNLEAWYRSIGISGEDATKKSVQYRDRAKERRLKYNEPDIPPANRLKDNYMKTREATVSYEQPTKLKIGGDNVGNKLLQKMGWQEGMGLGKKNQGRTDIIQAEARPMSAGLGIRTQGVTPGPGETYKDCVKKMMRSRYEEAEKR